MKSLRQTFLALGGAAAAIAGAATYARYRKDVAAAEKRIDATKRRHLDSPDGRIEYASTGSGPYVLSIHGAGGGFDQGLDLARAFLPPGYTLIAPSRFGYLGTPVPRDASAKAQTQAHLRLLDELEVERCIVLGVSAGAPSAMQLALNHPDRCNALILVVPLAFTPDRTAVRDPSSFFAAVLNTIASSDFIYWSAMRIAPSTLVRTILGTPIEVYRNATPRERLDADEMMRSILPISRRCAGIMNDGVVASTLPRYELERMKVPTLLISAKDDLYGTYASSLYTSRQIPGARFVGFESGGHLLLGHESDVRDEVGRFAAMHVKAPMVMTAS